jgi:hypothetical protein
MSEHLDSTAKTGETQNGRATMFYWFETDDLQKVERTWLNIYELDQGVPPILNRAKSPLSGV